MVYSYHAVRFQSVSFVQGTNWSQTSDDRGVLYKALGSPFSKVIVQHSSGSKKLYRVPKDRTVIISDRTVHLLGEIS